MRFLLLTISLFTIQCSVLNEEETFDLNPDQLSGEWSRVEFSDTFHINKIDEDSEEVTDQYIRYEFIKNSFNTCRIYNSERPVNFYGYCRWNLYGEYPDIFLSIEYKINNSPTKEFQSFLYLIKDRSENRIKLRTIRQSL